MEKVFHLYAFVGAYASGIPEQTSYRNSRKTAAEEVVVSVASVRVCSGRMTSE